MTLVYAELSAQLKKCSSARPATLTRPSFNLSQKDGVYAFVLLISITADIFIRRHVGAMCFVYFILTDKSTVSAIKAFVDSKNIEIMEGLEQYYAEGLVYLAEISLTFSAVVTQSSLCVLYIPVTFFCIYQPFQQFRANVKAINSESLCMSSFEKATSSDLSSYDDVCAVCLCAMTHARITPCKHIFHGKCLKDCLQKKAQCPMCNTKML